MSVDALRADRVGAYSGRETTPFIDGLAASGSRFANAFVPLPATDPSHASLLTGLHPLQHGVLTNAVALPEDVDTLAEILGAAGYYTMGVVSVAHLRRTYAFDQGFDAFSDTWDTGAPLNDAHQRGAEATNASAVELLDEYTRSSRTQPFFLFVHYFDVHAPYVAHESPAPTVEDSMEALYDDEVRYVDERLAELHAHLASLGLAGNLVTIVTSDHGEQLGEHGFEGGHADIYGETIQVPLVVEGPGIEKAVQDERVSVMDVVPTVVELAGLEPGDGLYGESLLGPRDAPADLLVLGYPQYTRSLGLLTEERYYIRNLDPYYMHMVSEETSARGGLIAAEPLESEGLYRLPLLSETDRIEPVYVTLEVELEEASCRARLSVRAEPRLEYFAEPVAFDEAIRVHLPAVTLRDSLTVAIEPADCVAGVRYLPAPQTDIDAFRAGLSGSYDTQATKIWRELLTERKRRVGDELYRLDDDPGMLTNLLDSAAVAEERRALTARWLELAPRERRVETGPYTEEEIELLKSLGYLR